MAKALKDGMLVKTPAKESTAQWKPSVASFRGKFPAGQKPNVKVGMPKVNPLEAPKGELARAMKVPNPK